MKIFITGGTGNIGQYVTKQLAERGHDVRVLTRTPERIPAMAAIKGVTLVKGTLKDFDSLKAGLAGCDAVIHIALGWGNDPVAMLEQDTRVTAFLALEAEKAGVKNFVYTSSTAVMGNLNGVVNEESLRSPGDLYGATKGASELFLLGFNQFYREQGGYSEKTNLRRNIIRPGYTFSNPAWEGGASQSDTRFKDIAHKVLTNQNIELSGNDGTQFISSGQIAELYVKLTESDLNGEIFFALGKNYTKWVDIAKTALELVPESTSKIITPEGEKPWGAFGFDVSKMERVFGLSFDATAELREHVRWNIERERTKLAGGNVPDILHLYG
jgi:UDP-glucose 4-epimerase